VPVDLDCAKLVGAATNGTTAAVTAHKNRGLPMDLPFLGANQIGRRQVSIHTLRG
jgi:hypothetical protein